METVQGSLSRRFGENKFTPQQLTFLSKYFYHISAAPACGEYALNSLLKPIISYKQLPAEAVQAKAHDNPPNTGRRSFLPPNMTTSVYAREPLEQTFRENYVPLPPTLIMYGDDDWLQYNNIDASIQSWKRSSEGKPLDVRSVVVRNAGHHIYMDNPLEFHDYIAKFQQNVYHTNN